MKPSWHRTRVVALALTAALAAAACSSPQGTEQPENSLLGQDDKGKGGGAGGGKKPGAKKPGGASKGAGGGEPIPATPGPGAAIPSPGGGKPGLSGASKTETEQTSSGDDPRTASVVVTEPDPDADKSGVAPDFADIYSTRVEGAGPNLKVTVVLRGTIPEKMPDDKTYMVIGFGLTGGKGDKRGYAFGASADSQGWTAYGGSDKGGAFEGQFSMSGDTAVFTMPWATIGGARPFEWYAQTSWFRSLAGTTHYSLDALPNEGPAKYPAG